MKIIDPKNIEVKGAAQLHLGEVGRQTLVDKNDSSAVQVGCVRWGPGARTKWHTHDSEQILYFTEGKGTVANEKEECTLTAGMIAVIAKGEKHWHGGTKTTGCTHLTIAAPHGTEILE